MKTIDKVTITNLDVTLRLVGIEIDQYILDKIIDIVELLEIKGDDTTLKDISELECEWERFEKRDKQ